MGRQGEEPDNDDEVDDSEVSDPGYSKLCSMARDLRRENLDLSFSRAFSICASANPQLMVMSKKYHHEKIQKLGEAAMTSNPSANPRATRIRGLAHPAAKSRD